MDLQTDIVSDMIQMLTYINKNMYWRVQEPNHMDITELTGQNGLTNFNPKKSIKTMTLSTLHMETA